MRWKQEKGGGGGGVLVLIGRACDQTHRSEVGRKVDVNTDLMVLDGNEGQVQTGVAVVDTLEKKRTSCEISSPTSSSSRNFSFDDVDHQRRNSSEARAPRPRDFPRGFICTHHDECGGADDE